MDHLPAPPTPVNTTHSNEGNASTNLPFVLKARLAKMRSKHNLRIWLESGLSRTSIYKVLGSPVVGGTRTRFATMYALFESVGVPFERAIAEALDEPLPPPPKVSTARRTAFKDEGQRVCWMLPVVIAMLMARSNTPITTSYKLAMALGLPTRHTYHIARVIPLAGGFVGSGDRGPGFSLERLVRIARALGYPLSKLVALAKRWKPKASHRFGRTQWRLHLRVNRKPSTAKAH